jgi:hypothetical protein
MNEIIRKVRIGNQDVDAVEMSFQTGGEHWNEYLLSDGSVLKLKPVVTQILKMVNQYDQEGNPVYVVKAANVVAVSASDRARRPPSPPIQGEEK